MNSDSLKNFIAVAELENMTRAAEQLHLSQPALSRSIMTLESELGCELFIRQKKEIKLSPKGKIFLDNAKKIVHQSETRLWDEHEIVGTVRIGLMSTSDSLNGMIFMFKKKYPGVNVRLYSDIGKNESIFNKLDLIAVEGGLFPDYDHMMISSERSFFALMNENHPLAGNQALDFTDLANEQLIFNIDGDGNYSEAYNFCIKEGFIPKSSFVYEQNKYQLELICNTNAIAIVTNTFKSFRNTVDGIVTIPLNSHYIHKREIHLVKKKDVDNPLAEYFWKTAHEYLNLRTESRNRGLDIEDTWGKYPDNADE